MTTRRNRAARASLGLGVLGIVGLIGAPLATDRGPDLIAELLTVLVLASPLAVVTGLAGLRRARDGGAARRAAVAGLSLGLLGFAAAAVVALLAAAGTIDVDSASALRA